MSEVIIFPNKPAAPAGDDSETEFMEYIVEVNKWMDNAMKAMENASFIIKRQDERIKEQEVQINYLHSLAMLPMHMRQQ